MYIQKWKTKIAPRRHAFFFVAFKGILVVLVFIKKTIISLLASLNVI